MEDSDKLNLVFISIIWALFRLPFVQLSALLLDENLYAQMTNEFIKNPGLVPTFLGNPVAWRPLGYFFVNAPFVLLGKWLGLGTELTYRLSGLFFSLATLFALYFLVKSMYKNRDLGLFSALIYGVCYDVVFVNNLGLTDNLLMFLVVVSLYFYFRGKSPKDFAIAATVAFGAYFVKTVMAFVIPFLALFYWYMKDKKVAYNKYFLLSLGATPLAAVLFALVLSGHGFVGSDILTILVKFDPNEKPYVLTMAYAIGVFLAEIIVFAGFSAYGIVKRAKAFDPFLFVWLSLLPMLIWGSAGGMPWYLLVGMPPVAITAAVVLLNSKLEADTLSLSAVMLLIILSLLLTVFVYSYSHEREAERPAGAFLAGKGDVLYVGDYAPAAIFYKLNAGDNISSVCVSFVGKDEPEKELNDSEYFREILAQQPSKYNFTREINDIFWEKQSFMGKCPGFVPDYIMASMVPRSVIENASGFVFVKSFGTSIKVYKRQAG